ncbi:MAG: DUF2911 domain-containing protein [Pseudomonas sp.]
MRIALILAGGLLVLGSQSAATAQAAAVSPHCAPQRPGNLATRPSPYDSLSIVVGGQTAMLCYGRPSAKGRKMIGGTDVAFGELWRTGANEPTIIHIPFAAMIAGVHVEPGSYSLYTVPGQSEWEIILNRSIAQWGEESRYTAEIKAKEAGRGKVKSEAIANHVETLVFRTEPAGARGADLVLEWEKTRVRIPIRLM